VNNHLIFVQMKILNITLLSSAALLAAFFIFFLENGKSKVKKNIVSYVSEEKLSDCKYDCSCFLPNEFSSQLNDYLTSYIYKSEKTGVWPSMNVTGLRKKARRGDLVFVPQQKHFTQDTFYYSYALLTPETLELMDSISIDFNSRIKGSSVHQAKLIVTSMTRTISSVNRLLKRNRSAVKRSAHLNGNAFDFSFSRFAFPRTLTSCEKIYLQETIAQVLFDWRKRKKCWVTFEKYQECLHVVSRRN